MNKIILLILIIFSNFAFSQDNDWTQTTFKEDSNSQYWVGLSSEQDDIKKAIDEAYLNAINDAAKFNFGFFHKGSENFYSTLKEKSFHQESQIEFNNIFFSGLKPLRQKVIETKNSKFIVYKEISYSKKEIEKEKTRLLSLNENKKEEKITVTKNNFNGNIVFKSKDDCIVKIQGSNNFEFYTKCNEYLFLPLGKYLVKAQSPNKEDVLKEVIITGTNEEVYINFSKKQASIQVSITPQDAILMINGNKYFNNEIINLQKGKYKVLASHDNYYKEEKEIELADNQSEFISINLRPKKNNIIINTEPQGAEIFINGEKIGETPLISLVPIENFTEISVVKKGYQFETVLLKERLNNKSDISIKLKKLNNE
jgi:hypothetical protein